MTQLYNFLKKTTSHLDNVTYRSIYGLNSVFVKNKVFLLITKDQRVVIRIEDEGFLAKRRESMKLLEFSLNNKVMDNWYLVPENFNKKKNKMIPLINDSFEALFSQRKKKKKNVKKKINKSKSVTVVKQPQNNFKNNNIFTKIFNIFKI